MKIKTNVTIVREVSLKTMPTPIKGKCLGCYIWENKSMDCCPRTESGKLLCIGNVWANNHTSIWVEDLDGIRGIEMKIKIAELTGTALNWAVAKCDNRKVRFSIGGSMEVRGQTEDGNELPDHWDLWMPWNPSTYWEQGGPIIEREKIGANWIAGKWQARGYLYGRISYGETLLIAALRYYVASRLGEEVEMPEELK